MILRWVCAKCHCSNSRKKRTCRYCPKNIKQAKQRLMRKENRTKDDWDQFDVPDWEAPDSFDLNAVSCEHELQMQTEDEEPIDEQRGLSLLPKNLLD